MSLNTELQENTQTQDCKIIFQLPYQNLQTQIRMIVTVQRSALGPLHPHLNPVAVAPGAFRPAWVRGTWSHRREVVQLVLRENECQRLMWAKPDRGYFNLHCMFSICLQMTLAFETGFSF